MKLKKITLEQLDSFQDFIEGTLRGQIMNVGEGFTSLGECIDCFKVLNEVVLLKDRLTKAEVASIHPAPVTKITPEMHAVGKKIKARLP